MASFHHKPVPGLGRRYEPVLQQSARFEIQVGCWRLAGRSGASLRACEGAIGASEVARGASESSSECLASGCESRGAVQPTSPALAQRLCSGAQQFGGHAQRAGRGLQGQEDLAVQGGSPRTSPERRP